MGKNRKRERSKGAISFGPGTTSSAKLMFADMVSKRRKDPMKTLLDEVYSSAGIHESQAPKGRRYKILLSGPWDGAGIKSMAPISQHTNIFLDLSKATGEEVEKEIKHGPYDAVIHIPSGVEFQCGLSHDELHAVSTPRLSYGDALTNANFIKAYTKPLGRALKLIRPSTVKRGEVSDPGGSVAFLEFISGPEDVDQTKSTHSMLGGYLGFLRVGHTEADLKGSKDPRGKALKQKYCLGTTFRRVPEELVGTVKKRDPGLGFVGNTKPENIKRAEKMTENALEMLMARGYTKRKLDAAAKRISKAYEAAAKSKDSDAKERAAKLIQKTLSRIDNGAETIGVDPTGKDGGLYSPQFKKFLSQTKEHRDWAKAQLDNKVVKSHAIIHLPVPEHFKPRIEERRERLKEILDAKADEIIGDYKAIKGDKKARDWFKAVVARRIMEASNAVGDAAEAEGIRQYNPKVGQFGDIFKRYNERIGDAIDWAIENVPEDAPELKHGGKAAKAPLKLPSMGGLWDEPDYNNEVKKVLGIT